jgi:hypothetical protein
MFENCLHLESQAQNKKWLNLKGLAARARRSGSEIPESESHRDGVFKLVVDTVSKKSSLDIAIDLEPSRFLDRKNL